MYYVGMLQDQSMLLFRSDRKPTPHKYRFFRKVMGPYESESEARYEMKLLRGRRQNPCGSCGEKHRMSNPCGNVRKRRKKNPEQDLKSGILSTLKEAGRKAGEASKQGDWSRVEHWKRTLIALRYTAKKYGIDADAIYSEAYRQTTGFYQKNPSEQVVSHKQALALTKKVIAHAKKLFKHEQEGVRKKNPGEQYHNRKFMFYMRELEKYKLGSNQYISALAKAYEHLESASESAKEGIR